MTSISSAAAVVPAPMTVRRRSLPTWPLAIAVLAAASGALTVWASWAGSRSDYYAAIAVSMSRSWSNFFFGAFDPAGTVTLDKIPGSFWIPALFVKAFGFSTLAVVLPNALAAVAATLITAVAARRLGGNVAGWIAGAVVATTPILVAVSRSNQPESFFVLGLALSGWAAVHAVQRASLRWLLIAGVFIAAAFQAYMLEAWALWPALAAAYLCTRQSWWRRLWHLAVAGTVSAILSVLWIVVVWLIPAGSRPYVGSTLHDDPWEMVFGYNGLGRFGQATSDAAAYNSFTPPFSGAAGVFRLFNEQLAGQIGWLIPTAVLAVAVLALLRVRAAVWVLLGCWLATYLVMFSVVAGMHQFYTAALAVPMALAVGTAVALARRRRVLWPQLALPAVAAVTAVAIGVGYGGYSVPVAAVQVLAAAAAAGLVLWERGRPALRWASIAATTLALVLTPAAWSVVTIQHPSATNPVAGGVSDMGGGMGGMCFAAGVPGALGGGRGGFAGGMAGQGGFAPGAGAGRSPGGGALPGAPNGAAMPGAPNGGAMSGAPGGGGSDTASDGAAGRPGTGFGAADRGADTALIAFLRAHAGSSRYAVAVFGAQAAAPLIIEGDGLSVLPIGGFSGSDPVPTLAAFQTLVADGQVRYVQASGGRDGARAGSAVQTTSAQIRAWVAASCSAVTDAAASGLYDCSSAG